MVDVSIVIATFRRPELVEKTIVSCVNQRNDLALNYEIIVVDNSSERSAEAAVAQLASTCSVPIFYVSEPRQNISLARNAGIAASKAPLLAFIDDDEQASEDWLDQLVGAQRKYGADAVFGPTTPVFEEGSPPAWDPNASYYTGRRTVTTGTEVAYGATGNVLFKYETCLAGPQPFDPKFGLTGGGDHDLSLHLAKKGRKLIWCAESHVTEFIPSNRSSVRYVLRRRLRGGQIYVWCSTRASNHPVWTAFYWMFVGLGQTVIWLIPSMVLAPFDTPFSARAKINLVGGIGKVLWMRRFRFRFYT